MRRSLYFCRLSLDTRTNDYGFRSHTYNCKPRTEEHGETCRSDKPTENGRQTAVLVLIAEIGGNNAENEGTSERRYLVMTC